MGLDALFELLGAPLGAALGVALLVMAAGVLGFWKMAGREKWWRVVMPVALAGGFVAGYAAKLEFPAKWEAEIWQWAVLAAAIAGVLLALAAALPRHAEVGVWIVLAAAAAFVTVRRIPTQRLDFFAALAGGLVLYLAALWPVMREPRLWGVALAVMLACGFAAAGAVLPFDPIPGQMLVLVTALAGLAAAAGIVRPLRGMVCGAGAFLAVMFGVLLTVAAFDKCPELYPWKVFWLLGAAPLGIALAWVPWLRRRPWHCALAALLLAGAFLIPALLTAWKNAPPMDA